jgi:hypothetical protein
MRQNYILLKGDNVALREKTPYQFLKTQTQNTMGGGKPQQTMFFSLFSLSQNNCYITLWLNMPLFPFIFWVSLLDFDSMVILKAK